MPHSPASPPLVDQFADYALQSNDYKETSEPRWTSNQHITGLGIIVSGQCGQPNGIFYSRFVVCGKSFPAIKEEVTLGYLESTYIPGETYEQRQARRRAFHAGMNAGCFILVPRRVGECRRLPPMTDCYIKLAPRMTTGTPDREYSQSKRNTKTSFVMV